MPNPRSDHRPKWSTPRRYPTPVGDRLNVAAIAEKHGIKPLAFVARQHGLGWPQIEGGKLSSVRMRSVTGENFREDTYLESEVDALFAPRKPTNGRRQLPDGRFVLNRQAVLRWLQITPSTLWKWATHCPHRPDKPLRPLLERMRSPETGLSERVYDEIDVVEVRQAQAAVGQQPEGPKHAYVTREKLMQKLAIGRHTVEICESKGLLHRIERPRRRGRSQIWYPQQEFNHLRDLLDARNNRLRQGPRGPCMHWRDAVDEYGWKRDTLAGYEKDCECLPEGRLVPAWFTDPTSSSARPRRHYYASDLDAIRDSQARAFDGCYDTPEGRRLNLVAASRHTGLSLSRLRQYLRRCSLMPGGRLHSVMMRPPNRPRGKPQHTLLETDLDLLMRLIGEAHRKSKQRGGWETVSQICRRYGITKHRAWDQVGKLLHAARDAGNISAAPIKVHTPGKRGRIREWLHFSVRELDRLLAGRSLADLAKEFAEAVPCEQPAAMPGAIPLQKKPQRGRKPIPKTQDLNQLCYVEYIVNNKSRNVVMLIVNTDPRFGPGTILNAKDVQVRARRWASKNGLPMPTKTPAGGEGTK